MINYAQFAWRCSNLRRYILDDECMGLLTGLASTVGTRTILLERGEELYRARLGCRSLPTGSVDEDGDSIEMDACFDVGDMKPLATGSREGRINPKGLTVLYLATDVKTCVAEVRPSVGARVSVWMFRTVRQLRIADLSVHRNLHSLAVLFKELHGPTTESIWMALDHAFGSPVRETDTSADYAPTQIVSEFMKSLGLDGIRYNSSLGPGKNVALFNVADADAVDDCLYKVDALEYTISECVGAIKVAGRKN